MRRENAAATFKRTFGYHPIGVWCDNTHEFLAAKLRAGNAGSNTTTDHIEVLTEAIAQVPSTHRRDLLIRSDGAGASHGLLDWLSAQDDIRGRRLEYSIGFTITEKIRQAIRLIPQQVWSPATNADGAVREGGDVAELTRLLNLTGWPAGMRVIVRRDVTTDTGTKIYFCDAASPRQRGSNENTNGLLRQYFPKSTDLSAHTANDLARIEAELNRRPGSSSTTDRPTTSSQRC